MLIGVVGKSNVGKTTFFSAATLVEAEISNRIFTTIEPNKGVTYVRTACPCGKLNDAQSASNTSKCSPRNSKCVNGTRYVPVKLVDIAGLVPGAHSGKGLGNQFLSDIMEANALIHVVDMAGMTDETGNPCNGCRDPKEDIKFLEEEIDYWILGILKRNLTSLAKRMEATKEEFSDVVFKQLSGLGIKLNDIESALHKTGATAQSDDYDLLEFIKSLREKSKPIVIAANKMDLPTSWKNFERIRDIGFRMHQCCADFELALRKAAEHDLIEYNPGEPDFKTRENADERHKAALEKIRSYMLAHGGTGVQDVIDDVVFNILNMIIVYPVENEHKLSDKKGNILPDAILMRKGSTALDLAFAVHEDIGKKFVAAVDAKTGRNVSSSYQLKNGDVISIKAGR